MKGFTLMEILVAMAIMGILASVGYAAYAVSLEKSRDAGRKSDLSQIARALEAYNNDYGVYPRACTGGVVGGCNDGDDACAWGEAFETTDKIYMKQLPVDPKNEWTYIYLTSTDQRSYQLYTRLENERDPNWIEYTQSCTAIGEACTYGMSSANVDLEPPLSTEPC